MYFELRFNVIMPPCVAGIVLYQETFSPNCTALKYAGKKSPGIRLLKFDPVCLSQDELPGPVRP